MLSPSIATELQLLVGTQFQVLFHSHSWVLFAFPSRYLFTIGHCRVFSLRRWSSRIPTGFLVSHCTWDTARAIWFFAYRAFTFCGRTFQTVQLNHLVPHRGPATPFDESQGLGCSGFARHYSRNRYYFLFLRLLRCFSSAGCRSRVPVLTGTGFPIRRSPDQSYFDSSPRLIVANHVLHRLTVPRHPLCAAVT